MESPEQAKALANALETLRSSAEWKILDEELAGIQEELENQIFSDAIDHETKKLAINRRNSVKLFRELPNDLAETLRAS